MPSALDRRLLFIVLGAALPLVLIAGVLLIQWAARAGEAPPSTPVVYVYQDNHYLRHRFDFAVQDGHLRVSWRPSDRWERVHRGWSDLSIELAVYDPRDDSLKIYVIEALNEADRDTVTLRVPEGLQSLVLSRHPVSPDGFHFKVRRSGRSGMLGELFGLGSRDVGYRLVKRSASFRIPEQVEYGAGDLFIGWVEVSDDGSP